MNLSFDLELKGLGSWITSSDNLVLFATLTEESAEKVKKIAKDLRDYIYYLIEIQETLSPEQLQQNEAKLNPNINPKNESDNNDNNLISTTNQKLEEDDKQSTSSKEKVNKQENKKKLGKRKAKMEQDFPGGIRSKKKKICNASLLNCLSLGSLFKSVT